MGAEDGTAIATSQFYALALFIYSLPPPPNPNPVDDRSRRGEQLFRREVCVGRHTPPLYTSNKLTPATGFNLPDDLRKIVDVLDISVGTDPVMATKTGAALDSMRFRRSVVSGFAMASVTVEMPTPWRNGSTPRVSRRITCRKVTIADPVRSWVTHSG